MRILAITSQYPRLGRDRIAPFNRQQFRALAKEHELRMIVPVPWTEWLKDGVQLNGTPRKYKNGDGIWVEHPRFYYVPKIAQHRYGQMYLASIREAARHAIEEFRPNAILSCWAHPDGWAAVQIAREAKLPVLIKVIGSDVLVLRHRARREEVIREALMGADGIVAVSHDLKRHVVQMGVAENRVHVIPEGLDKAVFSPGDMRAARARLGLDADRPIVLFVGNLLLSKGAGVLVEACRLLQQRGCPFECRIIGSGHDLAAIQNSIKVFRLGDQIKLMGSCSQAGLVDWYRASNMVVLPSFSEGIPNVLREAIACGRPYVATRVGGIPEISNPRYSRLVEPRDVPGLASAISEMLEANLQVDPADADAMNIGWDESARRLARQFDSLLPSLVPSTTSAAPKLPGNGTVHGLGDVAETRRMRVLVITNLYPRPGHPTIATYNREQIAALSRLHDVRLIVPVPWTQRLNDIARFNKCPRSYRNDSGIDVEHPTYYFPPKLLEQRWGLFFLESIRRSFRRAVREFRPEVVFACWAHPDGWAAVRLSRCVGLPVVVKVHGSDVLVATKNPHRRHRIADGLRHADAVIAVSADLAGHVAKLGVDRRNIHVIYNGVDATRFHPGNQADARARLGLKINADESMLLFVGNLLFSKGIGLLAEACAILRDRAVHFRAYFVGEGRDRHRLELELKRAGLEDRATTVGIAEQRALPDWYWASDLVVLPSYSEGIPNVLREAAMCRRPFVATNVGGISELAIHPPSRLVRPGDAMALADAIEKALVDIKHGVILPPPKEICSWDDSASAIGRILRIAVQKN